MLNTLVTDADNIQYLADCSKELNKSAIHSWKTKKSNSRLGRRNKDGNVLEFILVLRITFKNAATNIGFNEFYWKVSLQDTKKTSGS